MSVKTNDLDKMREILNTHPLYGVRVTRAISEYYPSKRYLSLEDAARRMVEINKFLAIYPERNTVEDWIEVLRIQVSNLKFRPDYFKDEVLQLGIFKFFIDPKFEGCIRIFADVGTLMDNRCKVEVKP